MRSASLNEALEAEIEALNGLGLDALRRRWLELHGRPAPPSLRRKLLVRALAYEMQARAQGGLSAVAERRLRALAKCGHEGQGIARSSKPRAGTRLVRDWNGATHVVDVVEDGFVWNGARHRSLSAIARAITGARWSGPRFFGLGSRSS